MRKEHPRIVLVKQAIAPSTEAMEIVRLWPHSSPQLIEYLDDQPAVGLGNFLGRYEIYNEKAGRSVYSGPMILSAFVPGICLAGSAMIRHQPDPTPCRVLPPSERGKGYASSGHTPQANGTVSAPWGELSDEPSSNDNAKRRTYQQGKNFDQWGGQFGTTFLGSHP